MTTVRVEIATIDDFRNQCLAPLIDEATRAHNAVQEIEPPKLGTFHDARETTGRHQTVVDEFRAGLEELVWELLAATVQNEEIIAAFREGVVVDTALLAHATDPAFQQVLAAARAAGASAADPTPGREA
jgi:hypothetical protein